MLDIVSFLIKIYRIMSTFRTFMILTK